ncbi:hypothetical protein TcasGA2_TC034664 [Tribolium castaneum]|uniref:Uncharacterized protein n=1 Tax=Tribolium castaneum TaxID=7070 RepID=A0A139WJS2_TRICA|nr:hypothetical protein TcasGA2_TC034664 [Tribolium castaneum]
MALTRRFLVLFIFFLILCCQMNISARNYTFTPYSLVNVGCKSGYVKIRGRCRQIFSFNK